MSLATMFQDKSREVALATALLIGAAGIYNNNAQADTQAVNHSAPHTQQAEPDENFGIAADYAKEHNTVAIWICAPLGLSKTPEQLAEIAEKGFKNMGISNAKGFSTVSGNGSNNIMVFISDDIYRSPKTGSANFDIRNINAEIASIKAAYDAKNATASIEEPSININ